MTLLPDGSPVVAWTDAQPESVENQFAPFNPAAHMYTFMWKSDVCGGAWQAIGQPVAGTLATLLVPPGSNEPLRAWISNDEPSVLTVERWNGTAFEVLGAPFQALDRSIVSPVMVSDPSGNPILAWLDGVNNSTVRVAQWSASGWQMLSPAAGVPGDAANTFLGTARALSLGISPDGLPVVAWPGTQMPANVAKFVSGTTWTTLGRPPNNDLLSHSVNGPIVRVDRAGDIFLAWISLQAVAGDATERVSVSRFDGTTWQALGGPLVSGYQARDYDMTIDSSGAPIVADSDLLSGNGGDRLFSYRWNGTAWQTPAPDVAAPGPLLQTYIYTPTIAIDGSGRLVAAWVHLDNSSNTTAIAVARYQP